jgi:hypothetical protein
MKKIFVLLTNAFLICSCGQVANTINGSLDINHFTRADAIRVFSCALTKEDKTAERFSLEAQLGLNKNLTDEQWQKLVDLDKKNAFDGVNNVAKKYNCF